MPPHPSHDSILARAALGAASAFGAACRWCSRRRYELAPGAATGGLTGLSWLHHLDGVSLPEHGVYGLALAATGALAAGGLKHKNKTIAAAGTGGLVMMADAWIGAGLGPSVPSLIAGAVATGGAYAVYVPWLVKSRQDRLALQVKAAKAGVTARGLGDNTLAPGITGSTAEETALLRALVAMLSVPAVDVTALDYTPFGWRAVVVLPPGRNTAPQKVIARKEQLAANLGLPGKLRLAKGITDNELVVTLYESDPLAATLPWPGPSTTTCHEPAALGLDAFGHPVLVPLLYNHVLIGGASDNGKSSLQSVLIAYAVACKDAEVLLVDLKPGAVELGPWRSCALGFADSPSRAMQLLKFVWSEVERRGKYLSALGDKLGKPVKKWVPGEHGPAWFVFIDELAELMRQVPATAKLIESLLQVARFVGITLVCATQSPSNRVFGGNTDGRQQYQVRIGLGAKESTTANLIFGPGAYGDGWCLDELDAPGKFLRWDRQHGVPVESRAYWMTDDEIGAMNHRYACEEVGSEARPHPQVEPEPEDDPTPPRPPTPPSGGPGGGRPLLRAVPTFPDGTEIADERHLALWQAVEKAGPSGITVDDLVAMDLPQFAARSSVNGPLGQWRRKGWVEEAGKHGRAMAYRTVPRSLPASGPTKGADATAAATV
ncbi:FtsK/SpoIIIE domain-containing protein (plasmid) [Streptomyces sp. NBC_00536]|uniref:FtsK/SpoIIIE domain-containing protein n=1 Tax=Streptomyces sp. NBC_00536 TaxID=2975769 RepID=UPI002E815EB5|nr:FtsK/SpoIIIE domain-containing protein [Streptomyces sp. NBC_00536]WUC84337.1 FtsK/SpoIIIE domain-containing protein [Streptomyces sp. NBC_00536]